MRFAGFTDNELAYLFVGLVYDDGIEYSPGDAVEKQLVPELLDEAYGRGLSPKALMQLWQQVPIS